MPEGNILSAVCNNYHIYNSGQACKLPGTLLLFVGAHVDVAVEEYIFDAQDNFGLSRHGSPPTISSMHVELIMFCEKSYMLACQA
jgi:hypothetical protein